MISLLRAAIVAASVAAPCGAAAQRDMPEAEALSTRLHELLERAEVLAEQGRHDRAEGLRRRAEELESKLHALIERRERAERAERADRTERERRERERTEREQRRPEGRGPRIAHRPDHEIEELLAGLEHGMAALRELGRADALEVLERVAHDVRRAYRERQRGAAHERSEADGEAERRLEILRHATRALRELDRPDAADHFEHAVHAHELAIEGRHDREAREIRETAPRGERLADLLIAASRDLEERGQREHASHLHRLADALLAEGPQASRRGDELGPSRPPGEAGPRDHPDRPESGGFQERTMRRIERLERELAGLHAVVRDLRREIRALRRRRD